MPQGTGLTADLAGHLRTLSEERRAMMRSLRSRIRKNLPPGYVERFENGALVYEIPLKRYPKTYNGRPLMLAALASRRSFVTLSLMAVYGDKTLEKWFREAYSASGKTLRMGKSCVHFRSLDDIPLDVIGRAVAKVPVEEYIRVYEGARQGSRSTQ